MITIQYFNPITDKSGFIHSIDNVVFVYYIKNFNMKHIANDLISIRENCNCDGWEKLNCSACSKYSWYQNVIHIGSIHISFGKMQSFDKVSRSWTILPLLRLEVNPNKHFNTKEFIEIMKWIRQNCTSGTLTKYDYAIDIPYNINSVKVYNSRKEAGLYKGTIYRGQRSQHGFLKIYDKAKEQKELSEPLTRIEHTLYTDKEHLSLEKIIILQSKNSTLNPNELDNLNYCIVSLCLVLQANNIDFEPYISKLNYRRRKRIEPYLYGNTMELEYDTSILDTLIAKVNELFNADTDLSQNDTFMDMCISESVSNDGFIEISDDIELPFE